MNDLRKDLISAFQAGKFLETVYEKTLSELESGHDDLTDELVRMHNDGLLDVIAGFKTLRNKSDAGYDFFRARRVLEKALPNLNSPVQQVMECVLHLVSEAGQDMAAWALVDPFINFCVAEPSRPKEALKQIEASVGKLLDLLIPTIIAGARMDANHYLNEAIRLTAHENIEVRRRAIASLGRIQYPKDTNLYKASLACLELSATKETDDQLFGNLIRSAFSLYQQDKSLEERIISLISRALSSGGENALHAASELFGFKFNELPCALLDILLDYLMRVKPQNKGTLNNIDYGLANLMKREDPTKGIDFLEAFLKANPDTVQMDAFDSVIQKLYKNNTLLNKLLTRWFLRGDRVLCKGIHTVVNKVHGHDMLLKIDPSELVSTDFVHIIFLARKAIGYLFFKPVTAVSITISLMHQTSDKKTLQQLGTLIFDPLLLNFPGKVRDFLIQQSKSESGKAKKTIETALKNFDKHIDDLKSTGTIPELHPPQTQRDAYRRHFSRLMQESLKEGEKKSALLSLFSKSVLLYGRKSINYIYGPDGKSSRTEIPLQSYGTEIEVARYEIIDPFGLDYMLRIFRAEKIKT